MCSLWRLSVAKNHNVWPILTFWGFLYRPPLTDEGPIWCAIADTRYTLICQISCGSLYSVALCWRKTPNCAVFLIRHLVLSPFGNNLTKLNTGTQLQTFPYPTVSKSFLYSNAFMAKSGAQTLAFKSVTDKSVADRQTKKTQHFWSPRRRVKLAR